MLAKNAKTKHQVILSQQDIALLIDALVTFLPPYHKGMLSPQQARLRTVLIKLDSHVRPAAKLTRPAAR